MPEGNLLWQGFNWTKQELNWLGKKHAKKKPHNNVKKKLATVRVAMQCLSEAVSHSRAAGSRRQLLGFDLNLFLPRRRWRLSPLGIFPKREAQISGVSEGLSFCSPSQPPATARSRTQVAEQRHWLEVLQKIYAADSAGHADSALSWWAPFPSLLLSGRRHFCKHASWCFLAWCRPLYQP